MEKVKELIGIVSPFKMGHYVECRPSSNNLVLFMSTWIVSTVVTILLYTNLPASPDNMVFDYLAWVANEGGIFYVSAADQSWPGQIVVHMVSDFTFGHDIFSYRKFEVFIILPITCGLLFVYLYRLKLHFAAYLVVPFYQFMYISLGVWPGGQRDIVASIFLMITLLLSRSRIIGNASQWFLLGQGLAISAATLIRPTLLIMWPLLAFADLLLKKQNNRTAKQIVMDHTVVGFAIFVGLGCTLLIGVPSGATARWFEVSILFNIEVYSHTKTFWESASILGEQALNYWYWYLVWGAAGAILLWKKSPTDLILLFTVIASALISFFVQGKGLGYHLLPIIPVFAILIASSTSFALTYVLRCRKSKLATVFFFVIFLLPVLGFTKKVFGTLNPQIQLLSGQLSEKELLSQYSAGELSIHTARQIATYINETTPPSARILFWGRSLAVNNLSSRKSPLSFVSSALLYEPDLEFSHFANWQNLIVRELSENTPDIILLIKSHDGESYQGFPTTTPSNPKLSDIIKNELKNYSFEKNFGNIDIYRVDSI